MDVFEKVDREFARVDRDMEKSFKNIDRQFDSIYGSNKKGRKKGKDDFW
jgi:hypothetical protein